MEQIEVNSERWLSLKDMDGEVWKMIDGCNTHQISNYGRVKSLERPLKNRGGSTRLSKTCILKERVYTGYYKVSLFIEGKTKLVSVHRLVAKAFITNPNHYQIINHKNENKLDNRAINLEWCTTKYNVNYGTGKSRSAMTRIETSGKRINQYTKDGELVMTYLSATVVEKQTGFSYRGVWSACTGRQLTFQGYIWRYEGDSFDKYPTKYDYSIRKKAPCRPIVKYSMDGVLIKVYNNGIRELKKEYKSVESIYDCLCGKNHTAYEHIWRYKGDAMPAPIPPKRQIIQYNLDYEIVAKHKSLIDATKYVKSKHSTPISNCLHGRVMTSLGYIWKYEDEGKPVFRKINKMRMDGSFVKQYDTIGEIMREFGLKKLSTISLCINGKVKSAFGFKWSYEEGED